VTGLAPTEITALARILGELDYYQLLHLSPSAERKQIQKAYHATSRVFHPDGNRQHSLEIREATAQISKRITEAYSVLRAPRRREAYDRQLESGGAVRMQLAEAEAAGARQQTEKSQGRTPMGRQYFNLAAADLKRGDFAGAVRNLKTALTFEPKNDSFKEQLADAQKKADAEAGPAYVIK
jgi:DnaJ-class molecular chaperone